MPRQIRLLMCKRCGCAIDTSLCGYTCDLDGTSSEERDRADMEIHVFEFVASEPLSEPAPASQEDSQ